jgi:hypothetical protein
MDTFQCRDGRLVEFDWTANNEMVVWTTGDARERIGSICFRNVEGAGDGDDDFFLVTNMHLEGPNDSRAYLGQGIGREIISRAVEGGTPVAFSRDDGSAREDGSHLTGLGPAFARKMVAEGLAFWAGPDRDYD